MRPMKVLFATDGSTPAREGEEVIARLFDRERVEIETFSVRPNDPYELPFPAPVWVPPGQPAFDPTRSAEEAATRLSSAGFTATAASGEGDPAYAIEQRAQEHSVDLVVVGASHTTFMGNLFLGSVSTHVLHQAGRSVLVGHRRPADGPARVLFATDGSSAAENALDTAVGVLDPDRCSFHVTTALHHSWTPTFYSPGPALVGHPQGVPDPEDARIEGAWQTIEQTRRRLHGARFVSEGSVLIGRTVPEILKEIDNVNASLVVVGARGLGPFKRTVLGSVSDPIVRHAPATFVGRRVR